MLVFCGFKTFLACFYFKIEIIYESFYSETNDFHNNKLNASSFVLKLTSQLEAISKNWLDI